jgi:hypothetical protein
VKSVTVLLVCSVFKDSKVGQTNKVNFAEQPYECFHLPWGGRGQKRDAKRLTNSWVKNGTLRGQIKKGFSNHRKKNKYTGALVAYAYSVSITTTITFYTYLPI